MTDKKWLVPDVVNPTETVCVLIEIPNDFKHIAAFFGAIEQLAKAYNWEDSYGDGSLTAFVWRDVIEVAANLVRTGEACMDCEDVRDCLDVDTEGIAQGTAITVIYDLAAENHIDELIELYDDVTPQSVFADIPDTAPSSDATDDTTFCYAVGSFVAFYAALKLNGIVLDEGTGSVWDRIKATAAKIYGKLKATAGSIWDVATGGVPAQDAQDSLYSDAEIDVLACCLRDEMRDAPLTETAWNSALTACESTNNIGVMLLSDNSTRTYIYFLESYNEALIRRVAEGQDLDCVCDLSWCHIIDFTETDGGFVEEPPSFGSNGTWIDGLGWRTEKSWTNFNAFRNISLTLNIEPSIQIESIEYTYNIVSLGTYTLSPTTVVNWLNVNTINRATHDRQFYIDGGTVISYVGDENFDYLQIALINGFMPGPTNDPGGLAYLVSVKFTGVGANPFGDENC